MRRVVLEAAVLGGVVRRGDDHSVGPPAAGQAAVVDEDRVGDDRRWRVAEAFLDAHLDRIRRKDLDSARQRRFRQGVGVHAEVEGTADPLRLPVLADGLADGENVRLVETVLQRRAAVPGGAEGDPLRRIGGIGHVRVIGRDQPRYVRQHRSWRRLAGKFMHSHSCLLNLPLPPEVDDPSPMERSDFHARSRSGGVRFSSGEFS